MVFRKQLGTALPLFADSHPTISFLSPDWLSETPYSKLALCNRPFSLEQETKSDSDSGTQTDCSNNLC